VKSPVELAAVGQGNRLIVELLVEFEVLLKKLPKWYDKIWFRYLQPISLSHASTFRVLCVPCVL